MVVTTAQYGALATFAVKVGNELARRAIVGREGCGSADSDALRAELSKLRDRIVTAGGTERGERTRWQQLTDKLHEQPDRLIESEVLALLIVADEVTGIRELATTRLPTLSGYARLAATWVLSDVFDEEIAAMLLAREVSRGTPAWIAESLSGVSQWLVLREPTAIGRRYIAHAAKKLKRPRKSRSANSELRELDAQDRAQAQLHEAIAVWWNKRDRVAIDAAFRTHLRDTFGLYHAEESVITACLAAPYTQWNARDALAYLRSLVVGPVVVPPSANLDDDPALRAIAALDRVLEAGNGLTVRTDDGRVTLEAAPPTPDPDAI